MSNIKAVVVGRHHLTGDEGIDMVARFPENMPASTEEVIVWLREVVFPQADAFSASVIFQAVPGQLAVALVKIAANRAAKFPHCGVIISVPGPRPAEVEKEFHFSIYEDWANRGYELASLAMDAVLMANPRAITKVDREVLTVVVVDPPMPFQFSHIEWLN